MAVNESTTDDAAVQFENYLPAMSTSSPGPGHAERLFRKLFRRRGGLKVVVRPR